MNKKSLQMDEHPYYSIKESKKREPVVTACGLIEDMTLSSLIEDFKCYCSSLYLPIEFAACCALCIVSAILPKLLIPRINFIPTSQTFQITSEGDIMLDSSLNHEYTGEETVPGVVLVFLAGILPFSVIAFIGFIFGPMNDAHSGLCVLITAMGGTEFFVRFLKRWVGRMRPNFYQMCGFDFDLKECTADEFLQLEGRQSFPSGHASVAFCGMTVLIIWFLGKIGLKRKFLLHATDQNAKKSSRRKSGSYCNLLLVFLSVAPFTFVALYIAFSRVKDFYHHADDVIVGATLGISCSLFSYHLWYPSIYSTVSGIPIHSLSQRIAEGRRVPASDY